MEVMNEYDVMVIGGGAAGLSAALVLSRARRTVAVVDSGAPRNAPAAHMQGFLSRDGLPPSELLALSRDEVAGYGAQLIAGSVVSVASEAGPKFQIKLVDGPCRRRHPQRDPKLASHLPDLTARTEQNSPTAKWRGVLSAGPARCSDGRVTAR